MITMENWATQAVKKLEAEREQIPSIKRNEIAEKLRNQNTAAAAKAHLMADAVMAVLKELCCKNETFAEAVAKGGSFVDCMMLVTKDLGWHAEGIKSCKKAVQFYLPGAEIKTEWDMLIPQDGQEDAQEAPKQNVILDLASFF